MAINRQLPYLVLYSFLSLPFSFGLGFLPLLVLIFRRGLVLSTGGFFVLHTQPGYILGQPPTAGLILPPLSILLTTVRVALGIGSGWIDFGGGGCGNIIGSGGAPTAAGLVVMLLPFILAALSRLLPSASLLSASPLISLLFAALLAGLTFPFGLLSYFF